ncbi:MAG: hypothetical protein ACREJ0_11665 [Geminicoccaceae bacterium]
MTHDLRIETEWLDAADDDPIERSTFAEICVSTDGQSVTELEDLIARTTRTGVRGSAYRLAYWIAENWWRLRWEPEANFTEWRLSHVMAAVGGGYAWPDIRFASDGLHVLVEARRTSGKQGAPVRYLGGPPVQVTAEAFEVGLDEFVERVLARLSSLKVLKTDLASLWSEVRSERADVDTYALRQLEALLGFDAGEAPEGLLQKLLDSMEEAGRKAVNEIAAASKENAAKLVQDALASTEASDVRIRLKSIPEVQKLFRRQADMNALPWQRAELAARLARNTWGVPKGPVLNDALSDLLELSKDRLEAGPVATLGITAGLRKNHGDGAISIVQRAKAPTGRRFEMMRLVADHMTAPDDDHLLPITTAKTDRQKFQRAFAVEFLLPFDELCEELGELTFGEREIRDDEIEDVAAQYQVSPLMVRTTLVNRGVLPREALADAS